MAKKSIGRRYKIIKINKEMTIGEILRKYPDSIQVLFSFGLGCVGCPSAQAESLEEASSIHGIDTDELVKSLNEAVS